MARWQRHMTWIDFQNELRKHFALSNTKKKVRPRVCRLKQTSNIRDYIKDFTPLMLKITDVSDKNSLLLLRWPQGLGQSET